MTTPSNPHIDTDPLGLIPTEWPAHPRVLVSQASIARTRELVRETPWARAGLDRLCKLVDADHDFPDELPHDPDRKLNASVNTMAQRTALAALLTQDESRKQRAIDLFRKLARASVHWPVDKRVGATQAWGVGGGLNESRFIQVLGEAYDMIAALRVEEAGDADDQAFRAMLRTALGVSDRSDHRTCGNHNTMSQAGRLSVALALGDRSAVADAMYGNQVEGLARYGIVHMLRHDYMADGVHWERTPGYHYYTLYMLTDIASAMANSGIDFWHAQFPSAEKNEGHDRHRAYGPHGMRSLKAAFDAPFDQTFDGLKFSLLHDSGLASMTEVWIWGSIYELAYEAYGDPKYAWLLNRMEEQYPADHPDRKHPHQPMSMQVYQGEYNFARLKQASYPKGEFTIAGDADIALIGRRRQGSSLLPDKGDVLLRGQAGDESAMAAYLFYGPLAAGHQSPAALHVDFHARGKRLTDAPQSGGYDDDLHYRWLNTTIAHNTVTIDATPMFPQDQDTGSIWEADNWRERISDGKLLLFQPAGECKITRASNTNVYPGVRLDRTLAVTADFVLDVFRVIADRPRRIDYAFAGLGDMNVPAGDGVVLPDARGYNEMTDATDAGLSPFQGRWRQTDVATDCTLHALPAAQCTIASPPATKAKHMGTPTEPDPSRHHLLATVEGAAAVFVSLWQTTADSSTASHSENTSPPATLESVVGEAAGDVDIQVSIAGRRLTLKLPFAAEPVTPNWEPAS